MSARSRNGLLGVLVLNGGDRSLRNLLQGLAQDFQAELHTPCTLAGIPVALRSHSLGLVVLAVDSVLEQHLQLTRELVSSRRALVVIVGSHDADDAILRVLQAGALAYLNDLVVMKGLAPLIDTVLQHVSPMDAHQSDRFLGNGVTLAVPEYVLRDGSKEVRLPKIAGRLLDHLVRCPGKVVGGEELMRAGWGSAQGVASNALHQQIYIIREALRNFGLEDTLQSTPRHGYTYIGGSGASGERPEPWSGDREGEEPADLRAPKGKLRKN